jgi:hypothetical protein
MVRNSVNASLRMVIHLLVVGGLEKMLQPALFRASVPHAARYGWNRMSERDADAERHALTGARRVMGPNPACQPR